MFETIKHTLSDFFRSRLLVLGLVFAAMSLILVNRLFRLQIVEGESYKNSFDVKIKKERVVPCTRGLIYDRNGTLLAYNELVYSVVIEDNGSYQTLKEKNETLNPALLKLFSLIEGHGDAVVNDFSIGLNASNEYEFRVEGTARLRFLSNVFSVSVKKLTEEQKNASAAEVMEYLCNEKHYALSEDTLSKSEILKLVTIRFGMSMNNYQKYVTTTVASDVSQETVAVVLENTDVLPGVSIQEDTVRKYHEDSKYAAHIIGYTGAVSEDELKDLQSVDEKYNESYVVGKAGMEATMETVLQGTQGYETFYVDNLGKVKEIEEHVDSVPGNDVYLTIDIELTKTVYHIIEQHLAGIISSKIVPDRALDTRKINSSDNVVISIDDVYFALINNHVLDISHFGAVDASETEKKVHQIYEQRKAEVTGQIAAYLNTTTPKQELSEDMQAYVQFMTKWLQEQGYVLNNKIDNNNETIKAWKNGELSFREYLYCCISNNWIDVTKLSEDSAYADADEIFHYIIQALQAEFETNIDFQTIIYEYLLLEHTLDGKDLCLILYDQGILAEDELHSRLAAGSVSAYWFMLNKIQSLQITPAQLALDPCSASVILTDVNSGDVIAMVTYPSYDNARLANRIDGEYYSRLLNDRSLPLFNRATQQKTAPGSTFKMLTSIAALEEGVITPEEQIMDESRFEKVSNRPKCWYYPHSHGLINVSQAIEHSCNYFFYEAGYRMSTDAQGQYDEDLGIAALTKYAKQFGFSEKSGVEIEESMPSISQKYPVMSAIGQAEHSFTTANLAKYVSAVANGGTVYDLTLLDKTTTSQGELLEEFAPKVYQKTDFRSTTWNCVHEGMRAMAHSTELLRNLKVEVAGKTGTAQENPSRPNHALFVGYAPYHQPEISVAIKIAYGYTSSNAVSIARDVLQYYFGAKTSDEIITGSAIAPGNDAIHD